MNPPPKRSVLILAGGASRRLGSDKASTVVGDRTVLERVLGAALAADLGPDPDVLVSVREAASFRRLFDPPVACLEGVRFVEDGRVGLGPVAGLAVGLQAARHEAVGVFTADMPFLDTRLVDGLLDELESGSEDVVLTTVGDRLQRLCGAYRSSVGRVAESVLATVPAGETRGPRVHDLFEDLSVRVVSRVGELGEHELAVACRGINTPADLEWAQRQAARHRR